MGGGIMAKSSPFLPRHMLEPYCKLHPSYPQTCFTNRSPVSELQDIPRWCNVVRQHNLKEVAVQWLSWLCSYPWLPASLWSYKTYQVAIMVMLISFTGSITVELQDIPSCCHGYAHILDWQHHCEVARHVPSLGLEVQPMWDTYKKKQHSSTAVNPLLELSVNWSTPTMLSMRKNSLCFSKWSSFRLEIRSSEVHHLHGYAWLLAMAVMVIMLTSFTSGCIITAYNSPPNTMFFTERTLSPQTLHPFSLQKHGFSQIELLCTNCRSTPLLFQTQRHTKI